MNTKQKIILSGLSMGAVLFVLPYFFELNHSIIQKTDIPVSQSVLVLSILMQSAVFVVIAVWAGSYLAKRSGLVVFSKPLTNQVIKAIITGALLSLLILFSDYFFYLRNVEPNFFNLDPVTPWKTLLACFYGGIVEEVLMRLFLLSLIFFLCRKAFPGQQERFSAWLAIFIAAFIFAVGHIPAVQLQTEVTGLVIIRIILLNLIPGLAFGYIYWKEGLVLSMIAHFSADILLVFLFPVVYF